MTRLCINSWPKVVFQLNPLPFFSRTHYRSNVHRCGSKGILRGSVHHSIPLYNWTLPNCPQVQPKCQVEDGVRFVQIRDSSFVKMIRCPSGATTDGSGFVPLAGSLGWVSPAASVVWAAPWHHFSCCWRMSGSFYRLWSLPHQVSPVAFWSSRSRRRSTYVCLKMWWTSRKAGKEAYRGVSCSSYHDTH